jgi:hypothetical protein
VAEAAKVIENSQRDLNIAPRSEPYMDALSEADPRDMSANEQFVQRNAPVRQPYEDEYARPDGRLEAYDDYGTPAQLRAPNVIPEYHNESDPYEMEPDGDADDYGANPAMMALRSLRGGR